MPRPRNDWKGSQWYLIIRPVRLQSGLARRSDVVALVWSIQPYYAERIARPVPVVMPLAPLGVPGLPGSKEHHVLGGVMKRHTHCSSRATRSAARQEKTASLAMNIGAMALSGAGWYEDGLRDLGTFQDSWTSVLTDATADGKFALGYGVTPLAPHDNTAPLQAFSAQRRRGWSDWIPVFPEEAVGACCLWPSRQMAPSLSVGRPTTAPRGRFAGAQRKE